MLAGGRALRPRCAARIACCAPSSHHDNAARASSAATCAPMARATRRCRAERPSLRNRTGGEHGPLRRDHHRHRRRRRHAGLQAGAVGQAHPAPRARRLRAAREGELELARGQRRGELPHQGGVARQGRQASSTRTRTTTSAATPSSTAPRCSACASRTSARSRHHGGISPAWPISYDELEPYYTQAEHLYHVHGERGDDPTEPPASAPYRIPRQPRAAHPAAGRRPGAARPPARSTCRSASCSTSRIRSKSKCIRCDTCDGYPVPGPRQGRRAGDLRRSGAGASRTSRCSPTPTSTRLETERLGPRGDARCIVERNGATETLHGRHRGRRRAARSTPRRCCCARPTTSIRTAWPTARTSSAATTWATSTRCCWRSRSDPNPTRLPEDASAERLLLRRRRTGSIPMGHISFVGKLDANVAVGRRAGHRAGHDARVHGEALARLLADVRGSARPEQPRHARPRRRHRARLHAQQRGGAQAADGEARRACCKRHRLPRRTWCRCRPTSSAAHSAGRRGAPERHDPLRPRPADVGARRELQGARARQPLRRRRAASSRRAAR